MLRSRAATSARSLELMAACRRSSTYRFDHNGRGQAAIAVDAEQNHEGYGAIPVWSDLICCVGERECYAHRYERKDQSSSGWRVNKLFMTVNRAAYLQQAAKNAAKKEEEVTVASVAVPLLTSTRSPLLWNRLRIWIKRSSLT